MSDSLNEGIIDKNVEQKFEPEPININPQVNNNAIIPPKKRKKEQIPEKIEYIWLGDLVSNILIVIGSRISSRKSFLKSIELNEAEKNSVVSAFSPLVKKLLDTLGFGEDYFVLLSVIATIMIPRIMLILTEKKRIEAKKQKEKIINIASNKGDDKNENL